MNAKRTKKIKLINFILILLIFGLVEKTAAQNVSVKFGLNGGDTVSLNMNDCIEATLNNNPDLIISKYNINIQEQQILKRKADFDPYFQADISTSENQSKAALTGVSSKSEQFQYGARIGAKLKTGADVYLSHSSRESENNASSSLINPSYTSDLSLNFTQPLLKNRGSSNNTAMLKIEKNNKLITDLSFKKNIIDVVAELQKNYWELVYSIEAYKVQEQSLQLSENLYNDNIKRVNLGALAQIEIIRAEAGVAEQTEKIISAENYILNQQDMLLLKMNMTKNRELASKRIIPTEFPEPILNIPNPSTSLEYALNNNPDYLKLKKEFENAGIRLDYYSNQKLPSLNFQSSVGLNATDISYSKSYSNLNEDNKNWQAGLVFSVPIGNKTGKANLENEKFSREKLIASLTKLENNILTDINIKIRNINSSIKQVKAAEKSVKLAEENLEAELKRFELNQTTTYDVLKFQEALAAAKIRLLKAVIDNRKAWIEYDALTALILEKNNLRLN